MKTHFLRSSRPVAVALMAACLTAAPALAQPAGTNEPTPGTTGSSATRATPGGASTTASENRSATGTQRSAQTKLDRSDKNFIEKAAKSGLKEQHVAQLGVERATNPRVREFAQQLTQDHQRVNQELVRLAESKGVEFEGDLARLRTVAQSSGSLSNQHATGTTRTTPGTATTPTTGTSRASSDIVSTGAGAGTAGTAGSPQRRQDTEGMRGMADDRDLRRLSEATGRDFDERFVKHMVKEHEEAVKLFEKAAEDSKDPQIRAFASQHVTSLREHLQESKNLERAVAE
jgi:putative membrane protein